MAISFKRLRPGRFTLGLAGFFLFLPALCWADTAGKVDITNAWLRSPPHGHSTTLGFMTVQADQDMKLVGIRTAQAKSVSMLLMTRNDSVMRMDPVDAVALPAGSPVTFKMGPGSHFMQLKQIGGHLHGGDTVPMIAIVENARTGAKQSVRFTANVVEKQGHHSSTEEHGEH